MALVGNEVLFVTGLDGSSKLAATTQSTTTSAIAALAGSQGIASVKLSGSVSGSTILQAASAAGGTATLPNVTGSVVVTPNTALYEPDVLYSTGQVNSASTTTLATVTSLVQNVVGGATYKFRVWAPVTTTATGGIKFAFNYTTCTVSAISVTGQAYTTTSCACQYSTNTNTQIALISSTTNAILGTVEGDMTIGTSSGTVTLQFAQNVSTNGTASVYQSATMEFVRTV